MKSLALAVCCMFVLSSIGFAMPGENYGHGPNHEMDMCGFKDKDKETQEEKEARKAKMEEIKKENLEFRKNIDSLIEKYNKASDKKKEEIKKEIRALVAAKTNKDMVIKKEMIEIQKARITKFEEKIASLEADKDKFIDEKVDFITSAEGQAKMKEMREKKAKMMEERPEKNMKKDKKHNKSPKNF